MAEKIDWNFVVKALNGSSVSGAGTLEVEAYDKINVTITAGALSRLIGRRAGLFR
jgi:hypothetical protein